MRTWPLYGAAVILAVVGIGFVIADHSAGALAALAPLVGVFTLVGAAIDQLDRQRQEARQARLQEARQSRQAREQAERESYAIRAQAERESIRRFDERFTDATTAAIGPDRAARAAAAAGLLSFLRAENHEYHRQVYYFTLSYLKVTEPDALVDQAFVRVLQRAAHLALPELAAEDFRLAVDFSNARMQGINLAGLELGEARLTDAILREANLAGTCLWRAVGKNADISGASLREANLEELVLLGNLRAAGADFSFANLVAARFAARQELGNANLYQASFVGARLQGACLDGADLRHARFDGANLRGASFHGVHYNEAMVRSVVRAVNHSWRKAGWDPDLWCELKKADAKRSSALNPPHRKPSDMATPYYRRHPFPGHPNQLSRNHLGP